MSKIIRKNQKLFGDTGVTGVIGKFGSYKAGSAAYSSDPELIQSLPAWSGGFSAAGLTANAPALQDMNGLFHSCFRQIKYLLQQGIPEWNATTTYNMGSITTDGFGIYFSLVESNLNNALTENTKWFYANTYFKVPRRGM